MFGITKNFDKLLNAIINHEGYFLPGENGFPNGSLSYQNKNPGNLRSSPFASGERGGFAFFRNDLIGYLALQFDIMQKAKGNTVTGLNGDSTLSQLLHVYAPASDNNNTEAYIKAVCTETGFSPDMTLNVLLNDN